MQFAAGSNELNHINHLIMASVSANKQERQQCNLNLHSSSCSHPRSREHAPRRIDRRRADLLHPGGRRALPRPAQADRRHPHEEQDQVGIWTALLHALRRAKEGRGERHRPHEADRPARARRLAAEPRDSHGHLAQGLRRSIPGDDLTHGQALGPARVAHPRACKAPHVNQPCRSSSIS